MLYSVIVPTIKKIEELQSLREELENTIDFEKGELIFTCQNVSASKNRNIGENSLYSANRMLGCFIKSVGFERLRDCNNRTFGSNGFRINDSI